MSLKQQLQEDLKSALREKSAMAVSVLRLALASIANEEIRLHKQQEGLSDVEVVGVLKKEVKKRNDAIELYQKGGEGGRAEQEELEKKILEKYVPAQATREDIEIAISKILASRPEVNAKDFGAIMKEVLARFGGNADGKVVSEVLKKRLASSG